MMITVLLVIVCCIIIMITTTALTTTNKEANALNDIQKAMPPQLRSEMVNLYTKEVIACSPYAQHQNDNYTTTHLTETCYNALAGVAQACDPSDGMLYGFTTLCQDQRVVDFTANYYDPINRPFQPFQGLHDVLNNANSTTKESDRVS